MRVLNKATLSLGLLCLVAAACLLTTGAAMAVSKAHTRHVKTPDNEDFPGKYIVKDVQRGDGKLTATLQYEGTASFYLRDTNKICKNLKLTVLEDNYNELGFVIEDKDQKRFSLPYREPFPYTKVKKSSSQQLLYSYQIANVGEEFWLTITRRSTRETIFDTRKLPLVFTDKYLYIGSQVYDEYLYGLGERNYHFRITPGERGEFSFWNKDSPFHLEKGAPDGQTYGHHPMYLRREPSGLFHVGFLRNSYGMQFDYAQNQSIAFKVIGGIIEMKFFIGDEHPDTAIDLYHVYVNGWMLHPFWSMGWHQCRWGYTSSDQLLLVQKQYDEHKLPIDTIWSDIDYMEEYEDFTVNTHKFNLADMREMMNTKSQTGVHWVPIIDAGISVRHAEYCLQHDCYIKSNKYDGTPLMGCVWPGKVHYPDFNHPSAWEMWHNGLENLTTVYGLTPSGFWIDMDEFSNFVNGEIPADGTCTSATPLMQIFDRDNIDIDFVIFDEIEHTHLHDQNADVDDTNPFYDMPYNPCGFDHALDEKTLSLDSYFYNKEDAKIVYYPEGKIWHYDYHQLLGFTEGVSTHSALERMGHKLKFIVSRSTMFGAGRYMTLWQGDSVSNWEWLYNSIPYLFNSQMFGMPFTGSDICGFGGDATAELCARWMTLGTLYPFARNHNGLDSRPQEPYAYPDEPYVLEASRKGLQLRYSLLKYYYHLFVRRNGTGTVFRPLFFEFPYDEALLDVDWEFMIGDALLAAPVLFSGDQTSRTTTEEVTFPANQYFFDYFSGRPIKKNKISINVPFDSYVPLYIRAGTIVHTQNVTDVYRSRYLNNQFQLRIALDENQRATGTFMTLTDYNQDDGIIQQCVDQNCIARFNAQGNLNGQTFVLRLTVQNEGPSTVYEEITVNKVYIYGIVVNNQTIYKEETLGTPLVIKKAGEFVLNIHLDLSKKGSK